MAPYNNIIKSQVFSFQYRCMTRGIVASLESLLMHCLFYEIGPKEVQNDQIRIGCQLFLLKAENCLALWILAYLHLPDRHLDANYQ